MVHRRECEYAARISPKNLMIFNSLEAALLTGRRKCPACLGGR
jgi:hypothetical protein